MTAQLVEEIGGWCGVVSIIAIIHRDIYIYFSLQHTKILAFRTIITM